LERRQPLPGVSGTLLPLGVTCVFQTLRREYVISWLQDENQRGIIHRKIAGQENPSSIGYIGNLSCQNRLYLSVSQGQEFIIPEKHFQEEFLAVFNALRELKGAQGSVNVTRVWQTAEHKKGFANSLMW